ncbi:Cyclin-dependent kinase 1 (CDK1) (Cell division control protein 28) (Cell division protein kinase 1) [Durusdinium trenchii]|uniref:peptidylprolyl isomerase n=1 Tax=Durusdinium trenchii TaxID=1381693 RepID=A0ABP0LFW6_9DINO
MRCPALWAGLILAVCTSRCFIDRVRLGRRLGRRQHRRSRLGRLARDTAVEGLRVRVGVSYDFDEDPGLVDFNPALDFVVGSNDVAPAIDRAVRGMALGDRREVLCGTDEPLFGRYAARKLRWINGEAEVGKLVKLEEGMGQVLERQGRRLLVDFNHPLAGKAVKLALTLLSCEEVPAKEVRVTLLSPGDGATYPNFGDLVTLHMELWLESGKLLSSTRAGDPMQYHLGLDSGPGRGFEQGIQQLSLGSKAQLHVPSRLAYGSQGSQEEGIPPNADLLYKVEVLITCDGVVKLCDLCYGRGMDEPLRPYTPLEERVRDLSGREKCKLRYLAPEMILRKEVYGPAIDIWAVGCLLAEACLQDALFSADDEIGHLFQIFRLLGTPGPNHWPEAVCSKIFSVKFPQWPPFDFRRAVAGGPEAILLLQDLANRMDVYNKVSTLGRVLGASGIDLFSTLLRLDPAERCTASRALQCSFFQESRESRRRSRSRSEPQRRTRHKSQHSQDSQPVDDRELAWLGQLSQEMSSQSQATPATGLAQILAHFQLCTQSQRSFRIWRTEWPAVWTGLVREDLAWRPRSAPVSELAAKMNAQQVNFVVDMSRSLFLDEQLVNEHTLHLAVAYLQDFNSLPPPRGGPGLHGDLVALACLKMADSMNEVANEFFQRGRMESFTQIQGRWTAEEIMKAEVIIFHRLQSRLHRPTAGWFLHTSLAFGGFKDVRVKHVAKYINMLSLYDVDMQDHPAHLRAMASLLLAVYTCLASGPSSPAEDRGFWKQVRASGASIEALVPIFTRMCQLLTTQRFHWAAQGLDAVDRRYPEAPRCLPCHFSPNLADEFLQPLLRHVKSDRSLPSGAQ